MTTRYKKKNLIFLLIFTAAFLTLNACGRASDSGSSVQGGPKSSAAVDYNEENRVELDGDTYYLEPEEDEIIEEDGISFIRGEVLIYAEPGTSRKKIVSLIEEYGGVLVGETPSLDSYQARFGGLETMEAVEDLCGELMENRRVAYAFPDLVFESSIDYIPSSDTEWEDEWDEENPGGRNWGVEAIHATYAWDLRGEMDTVKVGVFDAGFYDHEDLRFAERHRNDGPDTNKYHGTHVSGTILAGFDNGRGISGVLPKGELYGFSCESETIKNLSCARQYEVALEQLIVQDGCCAVNISMNTGHARAYGASHGHMVAKKSLREEADLMTVVLKRIGEQNSRFLLCTSAGNTNGVVFVKDKGYAFGVRTLGKNEDAQETVQGGVEACYNSMLNLIDDPEVRDHIIVVGSCGMTGGGTYELAASCNTGERVDVIAPGVNILSTVENDGYRELSGTSMATPHVTGLAAMLFALDPSLSAAECKQIILDCAQTPVSGTKGTGISRGMIDCSLAVLGLDVQTGNNGASAANINWQDLYVEYLVTNEEDYRYCTEIRLLYLNDDDIPELACIMGNAHASQVELCAIRDGEVIRLGSYGSFGCMSYFEKRNVVISSYYGGGIGDLCVFALDDDWEQEPILYLYEDTYGVTTGSGNPLYKIGTEEAYSSQTSPEIYQDLMTALYSLGGLTSVNAGEASASDHHLTPDDISVIYNDPESLFEDAGFVNGPAGGSVKEKIDELLTEAYPER